MHFTESIFFLDYLFYFLLQISRLSFKMLRKGKDLFHRHLSEDLEGVHSKTKLAKIVVECRKEGNVNYTILDSQEHSVGAPLKWDKCRLALVKAVGGYMLEFYTPPKSTKVRERVNLYIV